MLLDAGDLEEGAPMLAAAADVFGDASKFGQSVDATCRLRLCIGRLS